MREKRSAGARLTPEIAAQKMPSGFFVVFFTLRSVKGWKRDPTHGMGFGFSAPARQSVRPATVLVQRSWYCVAHPLLMSSHGL